MKTILTLALLFGLWCLTALAGESGHLDKEAPLVKDGVLGTVNVLRELDVKTGKNLVTVKGNYKFSTDWHGGPIESTIDGSAIPYTIHIATDPEIITYTLPGLRTVSSLAIQYWEGNDAAEMVRLEGSADGGTTWMELFKSKPRKTDFLKCFKPAKVNQLRLSLEGGKDGNLRRITEVFVYADPEVPLPLFGGKDSGAFSFLRDLWYAGEIKQIPSPAKNAVWTQSWGGMSRPHSLFLSEMASAHDGCWGEGSEAGKRVYLRFDLDKAYPMTFGLIGCYPMPKGREELILAGDSEAEFYTAKGQLDPSTLKGSSVKDLTGQGWILQKTWNKDLSACKVFLLEHPGQYNQMLLVWDSKKTYEYNRFAHFEMFGVKPPAKAGQTDKQHAETRLGTASNSDIKPVEPPQSLKPVFALAGDAQWQAVPLVPQVVLDAGIRPGGEGGQWPQAICIDPAHGKFLLYGTDVGGIFRSLDGGKTFEPCNRGYTPRGNCGFAIDPVNINRALAIAANSLEMDCHSTDTAVVRSTDAGQTWQSLIRSVRVDNVKTGPDGGREAIAIRVHSKTRYAYVGTGCYGFWKFGPPAAKRAVQ